MILLVILLFNSLFFSLQICWLSMIELSIDEFTLNVINDLIFVFLVSSIELLQSSSELNFLHVFIVITVSIREFFDQFYCLLAHLMLF